MSKTASQRNALPKSRPYNENGDKNHFRGLGQRLGVIISDAPVKGSCKRKKKQESNITPQMRLAALSVQR
jgi:hypothetical protein